MTTTMVEKLLSDAKNLTKRLKEREALTDSIINNHLGIQHKINAMKQYQEIVDSLNETANHHPKNLLIHQLNKMNSKIEDLKKENSELQQSLEEHHEMLELIMSKYKQQSHKLSVTTNLEGTKPPCNYTKEMRDKDLKIQEMVSVIKVASQNWEEDENLKIEQDKMIQMLKEKNDLMRMILLNATDEFCKEPEKISPKNIDVSLNGSINTNNKNNNITSNPGITLN